MIPVGQRSVFYWHDYLAALFGVCVSSLWLEDVIGHIKALITFISFK